MPLIVSCRCSYLAESYTGAAGHVYETNKYIKAIKELAVNKWAWIPVRTQKKKLEQENRDDAVEWFGVHAADMLAEADINPPYSLVPIPGSARVVGSRGPSRTLQLARQTKRAIGSAEVDVLDVLRWNEVLLPAHRDGPRAAHDLYPHLVIDGEVPDDRPIVLVDDVLTMGGHLQAARAKLEEAGAEVIYAVCAGHAVHDAVDDSWAMVVLAIDDWAPPRRRGR